MNEFDFDAHEPVRDIVLAAGVGADLPAIREWLAALPASAYGRVFIESDEDLPALVPPAGVGISKVPAFFEPGTALAAAVEAWLGEWVWVEADFDRTLQLWTGSSETAAMRECRDRVQRRVGRREPAVAEPLRA